MGCGTSVVDEDVEAGVFFETRARREQLKTI